MSDKNRYQDRLDRLFCGGRVFHAYVITGPGREVFAQQLAAALVCEGEKKPCGRCAHCKKTGLNIHPDITTLTIPEGKREILVDQIRDLRSDVYIRPNEAHRKVYVITPADAMNDNAQNAFLKVLEEGPAYACFLLVAEQAGALLPTVRSRCEEVFLYEEQSGTSYDTRAEEFGQLLLSGEEKALFSFCVGLEKLNREELAQLLDQTVLVLNGRMKADVLSAAQIAPKLDLLKRIQEAVEFNAGVGHVLGWLCAASFQ